MSDNRTDIEQPNLAFLAGAPGEDGAGPPPPGVSGPVVESGPLDIPLARPSGASEAPSPIAPTREEPSSAPDPMVFLLGSKLFEDISAAQFNSIAELSHFTSLRAGEAIFEEGRPGTDLILILQGRVELAVESITPVLEIPLLRVGPGEVIGEMAIVGEQYRPYSAFTLTPCELLVVDAVELHSLMTEQPELGVTLMRNTAAVLAKRLRLTNLRLMNVLRSRYL